MTTFWSRLFGGLESDISCVLLQLFSRLFNVHYVATIVNISEASLYCCVYFQRLVTYGQIVTPGTSYARALVKFFGCSFAQAFGVSRLLYSLYTPGELFASMLNDLVISGGEEEIEKPDLTVVFYSDIAASCLPVYANQTWTFAHAHFMFWSSVSSEPSHQ